MSGSSSAVERQLPKLDVAGSIPVSRSINPTSRVRIIATIKANRRPHAKNHSVFMVRRQSRRGDEFLCFCLQEFKGCEGQSVWRSRAGTEGDGDVRDIPTGWARLFRVERRPAIRLYAGNIILREL